MKIHHSWLNVLGNNSYNFPHSHLGNDVFHSGVFYLSHENNNLHFAKDSQYFEIKPKLFDFLIPLYLINMRDSKTIESFLQKKEKESGTVNITINKGK